MKFKAIVVTGALMCAFLPVDVLADKRVALVVGNSKYEKVAKLPNPANDATDVAEALRQLDFKVIEVEDADNVRFNKALAEFSRNAADADAVMFFYAGHGIQYDGQNYFLPVDADIKDLADVEFTSMPMAKIRQALDKAPNGIRIMILDACRDNPLARSIIASRGIDSSASRGLARVDQQAGGMIVVYATQPNQVAQDGADRNSPFTTAFVKRLKEPGLEVGTLFRRVTSDVRERTNGKQVPEVSISLGTDYYLNRSETDVIAWGRVRDSNDPEQFRQFIARYPTSFLVPDAQHWIERLEVNTVAVKELLRKENEQKAEAERLLKEEQEKKRLALLDAQRVAKLEADRLAAEEAAGQTAAAQEHAKRLALAKAAQEEAERKAADERIAKLSAEKAAREEELRVAKVEAERRKQDEADKIAKLAADKEAARLAKLEADRQQKLEAERVAQLERDRLAKLAADKETARLAKLEADRLQKVEVERLAQLERDRVARVAAETAAREEAVRVAKAEAAATADRERNAKIAADQAAHDEALRLAKADTERLKQLETARQATLGREKADEAAREAAAQDEQTRLAKLEAERLATAAREQQLKLAAEKAKAEEAVLVAAAEAEQAKLAEGQRLAQADGESRQMAQREQVARDQAAQRARDEANKDAAAQLARANAQRQEADEAARVAALEEAGRLADAELAQAQRAEADRLAALLAEKTPGTDAPQGQQLAMLDAGPVAAGDPSVARHLGSDEVARNGWIGSVWSSLYDGINGPLQLANAAREALVAGASVQVASLDPAGSAYPTNNPPAVSNTPELFRAMQVELKRVGCLYGNETGTLNKRTQAALDYYAKANGKGVFKLNGSVSVTAAFIEEIRAQPGVVCAPVKPTTVVSLPDPAEAVDTPVKVKPQRHPAARVRPDPQEQDVAPTRRPPPVAHEPRPPKIKLVLPKKVRPVASPTVSNVAVTREPVKMAPMTGF